MRNLLISRYDWGQDPGASITGGSWLPQLPPENMLKIQPQLVAQAAGSSVSFGLNLGGLRNVGLIHFQRLVTDPGATITITFPGYFASTTAWAADTLGVYSALEFAAIGRPRIFIPPTPIATNSINVTISGAGPTLQIGYMGACEVWESPGGFSLGSKLTYLDESDIQQVPFGSTYVTFRGKRRRLNIGVDWIKNNRPYGGIDEAAAVKELMAINGFSSPVIGVRDPENTDDLERDAVWGLFKSADITNPYFAISAAAFQIDQLV